jgi:hypothetical protein
MASSRVSMVALRETIAAVGAAGRGCRPMPTQIMIAAHRLLALISGDRLGMRSMFDGGDVPCG